MVPISMKLVETKSSTNKLELANINLIGRNASQIESYNSAQIMLKTFRTQNYISIKQ